MNFNCEWYPEKGRDLLRETLKYHLSEEMGITEALERMVADLLHIKYEQKELREEIENEDQLDTFIWSLTDIHSKCLFKEDIKEKENDKVWNIEDEDLPLHLHDKWIFKTNKKELEERLSDE